MNLSDHSQSIHKQLAILQKNMHHITVHDDPFSMWLGNWGLPGWLKCLVVQGLTVLLALLLMVGIAGCALKCASQFIKKSIAGLWVVHKQERGIVGFLEENAHIVDNPQAYWGLIAATTLKRESAQECKQWLRERTRAGMLSGRGGQQF